MQVIHEIPGKVQFAFDDGSMLDTWTSYSVSMDEFREAIFDKALPFARTKGVRAWIVDSSQAKGAFAPEIQSFIGSDVLPSFGSAGVKYFVTISSQVSAVTNLTVRNYQAKTGPNGIQLVEVGSVDEAREWLANNR